MSAPLAYRRGLVRRVSTVALGLLIAIGLTGFRSPASGETEGRDVRVVLDTGRAYLLHEPPQILRNPAAGDGRPAMIVLHPVRNGPIDIERTTGFDQLADQVGVLIAYPEGVRRSFNAGLCCDDAAKYHVDDVGFLTAVVDDLRSRGAGRISVVGFSNGGMMAYRFACERPDLVSTVGVMSGTLEIPHCKGPIRALHLHGTDDTTLPIHGARYSNKLHCFIRDIRTIPAAAPGSQITIRLLPHFRHRWTEPGDAINATQLFWNFGGFSKLARL